MQMILDVLFMTIQDQKNVKIVRQATAVRKIIRVPIQNLHRQLNFNSRTTFIEKVNFQHLK